MNSWKRERVQFARNDPVNGWAWASEGFFQGGGHSGFFLGGTKRYFPAGPTVVKFHFINSKLREKHIEVNRKLSNFKTSGSLPTPMDTGPWLLHPPSVCPFSKRCTRLMNHGLCW